MVGSFGTFIYSSASAFAVSMPRGPKLGAKRGAKRGAKSVVPSKSKTSSSEEEELPDLESFLVDQYKWPSFADTLGSKLFKGVANQFSEVAKFREEFKEGLKPCYENRRVSCPILFSPRTLFRFLAHRRSWRTSVLLFRAMFMRRSILIRKTTILWLTVLRVVLLLSLKMARRIQSRIRMTV